MAVAVPFTWTHVSALATRAAELERIGEEAQSPQPLIRAARLYKVAVRIADDIDERESASFSYGDLALVRDELRTLATDTAIAGPVDDYRSRSRDAIDSTGDITRSFREIAARIEQRLANDETRSRSQSDIERRA